MFKRLFLLVLFVALAAMAQDVTELTPRADENTSTISVFVKNPEDIRALKEELKNLQTMAGGSNPEIESLLNKANRVAEMNDRCASISLNDLLDTTCARFYEVELPAFENEYMEVTGEVRLGSMRVATTLEERTRQLATCSDALTSILVSREQLLRLRGNVYLEPINYEGDFDAEYSFELSYDPARLDQQYRLANLWVEKCGSIVLRQSGSEFAPMFIATLKVKNDSLKKIGSNLKIALNKTSLSLRVDMRRPTNGAYYLNGVRLFERTLDADKNQSHLFFDIKNKKAFLNQANDAVIGKFRGREVFKKLKKMEMVGRWAWDLEKQPDAVVQANPHEESDVMTAEDSLTYKQGLAELKRAMEVEQNDKDAKKAAAESASKDAAKKSGNSSNVGVRKIPLVISGVALIGGVTMAALFNKKAKDEKNNYSRELSNSDDSKYDSHQKQAKEYQRNRAIGIGLAVAGGVGIALSFVF